MNLGWNQRIIGEKLYISQCIWLKPIAEKRDLIEHEISRLELENNQATYRQKDAFASLRPILRD